MSYDPDERRDTPLARKLKERIRRDGPITVAQYLQACLHDPEEGYYRKRHAIGCGGDFITAPEISQVFGELIGLWCAVVWQQMGSPRRVNLVELGPGRGMLMSDALRAARAVPAFTQAIAVHLLETSEAMRADQRAALGEGTARITWHDTPLALAGDEGVPDGPAIIVANEFLDTLPIEQMVYSAGAWHARCVGVGARGEICFQIAGSATEPQPIIPAETVPGEGDVLERRASCAEFDGAVLAARARRAPMAALLIDYGYAVAGLGDTLQAVCGQRHVSPFFAPGEMDLSHQVDFEDFARSCRDVPAVEPRLAVDGPVTQAEFLGRLGIMERASRLMAANPGEALAIETGVARLMVPSGMGTRFMAIGVRSPELPPPPGFA